jgi:DNA invertase Pin-like site-specific DNA recombinase
VDLVGQLHQQGAQFTSLTNTIDTGTPSGRLFSPVMASLAEMERELTGERTRARLEVARQLGRKGSHARIVDDHVGYPRHREDFIKSSIHTSGVCHVKRDRLRPTTFIGELSGRL